MEEGREEGKSGRSSPICVCAFLHPHVCPSSSTFSQKEPGLLTGQMDPGTNRLAWSTHMSSCYSLGSDPDPQKTGHLENGLIWGCYHNSPNKRNKRSSISFPKFLLANNSAE